MVPVNVKSYNGGRKPAPAIWYEKLSHKTWKRWLVIIPSPFYLNYVTEIMQMTLSQIVYLQQELSFQDVFISQVLHKSPYMAVW